MEQIRLDEAVGEILGVDVVIKKNILSTSLYINGELMHKGNAWIFLAGMFRALAIDSKNKTKAIKQQS
jgi:hypothetical protein